MLADERTLVYAGDIRGPSSALLEEMGCLVSACCLSHISGSSDAESFGSAVFARYARDGSDRLSQVRGIGRCPCAPRG